MMEQLIKELIQSVDNLNRFSWSDLISLVSLVGAWITIFFLIKDKIENKRPYLQTTFELVRDNLACVVLKNVGNVPLELKQIKFDEDFVNQLPERERSRLIDNKINNMKIFPGKQWIICLGVIVPEILENYEVKSLRIDYEYSKIDKKRRYKETTDVDFTQYSIMLVYVSEIDELRNQNKKLEKELKNITKEVKNIRETVVNYANLKDTNMKTLVSGYEKSE